MTGRELCFLYQQVSSCSVGSSKEEKHRGEKLVWEILLQHANVEVRKIERSGNPVAKSEVDEILVTSLGPCFGPCAIRILLPL